MKVRKVAVGVTGLVLGMGAMARAGDSSVGNSQAAASAANSASLASIINSPLLADDTTTAPSTTTAPAAAAPTPPAPLMAGLEAAGVGKYLDDAHIGISGYIEAGFFYDGSRTNRGAGLIPARVAGDLIGFPGAYSGSLLLDQVDLNIVRSIDPTAGKFDVGFNVDFLYGTDAWYTHSNGIWDSDSKRGSGGSMAQWDMDQAYVDVVTPLKGLQVDIGKFDTLLGNEVISPTGNAFYTHSYSFNYGVPLTQTGILGIYNVTDKITVQAGITRGWNQSGIDNNGSIDFLGQVKWVASDQLTVIDNVSWGPQNPHDTHDYQFVDEVIPSYSFGNVFTKEDGLTVTGDILYAYDNATAQWYGVCLYAGYTINPMFTVNARAEWFHDGHGHQTGVGSFDGVGGAASFRDVDYFEVTGGVAITPMPGNQWLGGLVIRPEVRVDFANAGVFDGSSAFGASEGAATQITCAIDAYWKF